MSTKYESLDILAFLCGISSTMPILTIPGTNISVFTLLSVVFLVYCIIRNAKHGILNIDRKSYSTRLQLWLVLALCSCLFGFLYYASNEEWRSAVQGYVPKTIIFLMISMFLNYNDNIGRSIMKGIIYGAIVNLVAATIDALIYYALGFSPINRLFHSYIIAHNIRYGMISLQVNGVIRSGGFNYDPAHIGMMAPMIFLYGICSKRYIFVLAALGGILASLSTTALICCFLCGLIYLCVLRPRIKFHVTTRGIFITFIFLIVFAIIIYRFRNFISIGYNNLLTRVTNVYLENENGNIRMKYLLAAPKAMYQQGLKLLTGTGFMTASEGYINAGDSLGFTISNVHPYDMENTYLAYLFDLGIIGIIVYVMLLIRLASGSVKILKNEKDNPIYQMIFSGIVAIILSGFFYHYTLFACQILLFISSSAILDQKKNLTMT